MKHWKILILTVFIIVGMVTYAGNTGAVKGIVVDDSSGNPVVDAKVVIEPIGLETATDERGEYYFSGLAVDIYSIAVTHVKYKPVIRENIIITSDSTSTEPPIRLERGAATSEVIIVKDKRVVKIQRDKGGTDHVLSEAEITDTPISSFQRIVQTVPGVVGEGGQLHIRGGRSDEVNYMVDGMTIKDPVTGTFGGNINNWAIKEISVKTGGFSAEYGGALSGIVNVVTKEGGKKYSGRFAYWTGNLVWKAADQGDVDINWELGGPIPIFKKTKRGPLLTFYTSGSSFTSDLKWLSNPDFNGTLQADQDYDYDYVRYNWQNFNDTSSKLTMKISPRMKAKLGYQYSWASIDYLVSRSYATPTVEHQPTQWQMNNQVNFEWAHTISMNLFYQIFLYRFQNQIVVGVGDKEPEEYEWSYDPDSRDYPVYEDRTSTQYSFKIDIVNQLNKIHQIKAGLQYNYYDLLENFQTYPAIEDSAYRDAYHRFMDEQAFYVLDFMDWDQDLVMNVGLRYDRRQYAGSQFSPRAFLSFAINDRTKFRFTYGIFYQPPAAMYVLQEKYESYKDQSNNQYLEAANAVAFEYGITYLLSDVLKLDMVTYYKNTSDLIKFVAGNSRLSGSDRDMPMNVDHSYAQGLEVQLTKGFANNYYWRLAYTLSDAKGTSSNPYISIDVLPPKEYPLDWDVTHNVILQVGYEGNNGLGASVIGYWHTGMPYTSVDGSKKGLVNDARFPDYKRVDMSLWKAFDGIKWFGMKYKLYLELTNVFDTRNITGVYADGSAALYSAPQRAKAGITVSF
ncbi:TonB-dependent receptor [bacterium]|nr:TonB-dependent receptor [bacterium]